MRNDADPICDFSIIGAPSHWDRYDRLPEKIRGQADKQYALFSQNPTLSLRFRPVGPFWPFRVPYSSAPRARRE
ncbi:MAG: hypothetical protein ABSE57_30415 [Bryobacteraceae bacterium]